jgi:hypothetical protein
MFLVSALKEFQCDEPLSKFNFKFNLRRYIKELIGRIMDIHTFSTEVFSPEERHALLLVTLKEAARARQAGGVLRPNTRPTLNLAPPPPRVCMSIQPEGEAC